MKILIAEDDSISREVIHQFLSDLGTVDSAVNGEEAISLFKNSLEDEYTYDLVCLDIMMPEVNGIEALKVIRKLEDEKEIDESSRSKVIMTTALSDKENVIAAVQAHCDAYLIKPISAPILFDKIRDLGFKIPE